MIDSGIVIKRFEEISPPILEMQTLFKLCNWRKLSDGDSVKVFNSSLCTFVAYKNDLPVGTGRLVGDKIVYAVFVDIMVIPEQRKTGVGNLIVENMIQYCRENNYYYSKLIATKIGKKLYERNGFIVRSVEEPGMIIKLR